MPGWGGEGDSTRRAAQTAAERRCRWCRRVLPERSGPGRPREFCGQACRQWDWVTRRRSAELALTEDELVVTRDALDRLHDELYVLTCAVEDTRRDLRAIREAGRDPTTKELHDILEWLLDAAATTAETKLNPSR